MLLNFSLNYFTASILFLSFSAAAGFGFGLAFIFKSYCWVFLLAGTPPFFDFLINLISAKLVGSSSGLEIYGFIIIPSSGH